MAQIPCKKSCSQLLMLTVAVLCVMRGTSFMLSPERGPMIKFHTSKVSNERIHSINHVRVLKRSYASTNSDQIADSQPKTTTVPFLNIANILTISRVIAIPFFMLSFVMRKVCSYVLLCITVRIL